MLLNSKTSSLIVVDNNRNTAYVPLLAWGFVQRSENFWGDAARPERELGIREGKLSLEPRLNYWRRANFRIQG